MNKKCIHIVSLALILFLSACTSVQKTQLEETTTVVTSETIESTEQDTVTHSEDSEMFTARDKEFGYDESNATAITLSNENVVIDKEGVYVLSGTLSDGQVIINASDTEKVQLVLNNVTITSDNTAPIYVKSADKVFLTLKEGSTNTLSTTGTFAADAENNVDGVIFATSDVTLNGTGSLIINSATGHGIVGKDDVVITGGNYTITTANHGISANDSVRIADGDVHISSGKDGIQVENIEDSTKGFFYMVNGTLSIQAQGDAISTSGTLQIDGGIYTLTTGDGARSVTLQNYGMGTTQQANTGSDTVSQKGLKSDSTIHINAGEFAINTVDDSIHSTGDITIMNGEFSLESGDDAIHSDAAITLENGNFSIPYAYEGIEGLSLTVNGGIYDMVTTDDGFNAGGGADSSGNTNDPFAITEGATITINGGTVTITSDGDSLDSNGSLTINGGTLNLTCNGNGNTAIDASGTYTNNGGDITTNDGSESGTGMNGMRPGAGRP